MSEEIAKEISEKYANDIELFGTVDKNAVSLMCKALLQQLQAYKDKEDKLRELLGNYKHYSSPTEKQLYENEDIVNKAYKILDGSDE